MSIRRPFNLTQWIKDNRDLLKPPVGNKNLYAEAGDYIVMVVGGPNARKDYHWNETEETLLPTGGRHRSGHPGGRQGREDPDQGGGDVPAARPHAALSLPARRFTWAWWWSASARTAK
jgi:3-hydroxyanthranilate 3,4-dioxygenase